RFRHDAELVQRRAKLGNTDTFFAPGGRKGSVRRFLPQWIECLDRKVRKNHPGGRVGDLVRDTVDEVRGVRQVRYGVNFGSRTALVGRLTDLAKELEPIEESAGLVDEVHLTRHVRT